MSITKRTKVFFDSSVIIAGLASSKGASYTLLMLAEMEVIQPYVSEQVVAEVIRNVEKKLPAALPQFFALFKALPFKLVDLKEDDLAFALTLINEKDAAVLAAAISGGVDVVVSLDRHFLDDTLRGQLEVALCTPAECLQLLFDWPFAAG